MEAAKKRAYYEANRSKIIQRARFYYALNKPMILEKMKRQREAAKASGYNHNVYYETHKARILARQKERYYRNKKLYAEQPWLRPKRKQRS